MKISRKFSDVLIESLLEIGYTHCYFVAGGNIMHLLNSVRERFFCVPFAHEVGAAIATEYHNASVSKEGGKAFCLVTAGPGLTNTITAMAGAWQESRELLVIGGQVKTSDLSVPGLRQRGIQEVDGVRLTESITKASFRANRVEDLDRIIELVVLGSAPRKGPVFIEIPLDVQAGQTTSEVPDMQHILANLPRLPVISQPELESLRAFLLNAQRPVLLLGGGVSNSCANRNAEHLSSCGLPLMTTYNGADRISSQLPNYFGRPNTWGMRYSNILFQQADCVLALGTRLGLQQTGFNWQEFAPLARLVQVDIDPSELSKGHPRVDLGLCVDADDLLDRLLADGPLAVTDSQQNWLRFCQEVKATLPLSEPSNTREEGYVNPYDFYIELSGFMRPDSVLVPCSSGSSFTSSYQAVQLRDQMLMLSNKSQAAMGYGLSGAIGVALANPHRSVVLVEGDGGFLQNIQELAVARRNNLKLSIFLWVNNGYASIRMTQKIYFNGAWLGCDQESGLGFPNWHKLFESFGIPVFEMDSAGFSDPDFLSFATLHDLYAVLVPLDPFQTFHPKISSRITASGSMESNPLHLIGPPLPEAQFRSVAPYLSSLPDL